MILLKDVNDAAFSSGELGDGFAASIPTYAFSQVNPAICTQARIALCSIKDNVCLIV